MWRLKIGEGGNSPYIYSSNNYLGRQTWEFDPNAGTPEERAEVEEARLNYYNNRHNVQPSSDLLWQMQFIREKKMKQTIPQPKIEDGEEVTYEATTAAVKRSVHLVSALQSKHGHWPAEHSGPLFFLPPLVMVLYITGHLNTIVTAEHRKEILRYIYCHQNEDGGWGLYVGGHSSMFCTALNYICMRLLGITADGGVHNACERGRKWILDHGGVTAIPSWGKTWLSLLGVYEWSGCNPMPPEFWLFPSYFPIHPGKNSTLNRIPKSIGARSDIYVPHTRLQIMLWDGLYTFSEPLLNRWPFNKLREKALKLTMDLIHYEDERTRYITFGCVMKALNMLACWVEDPNGIYFKKHLARFDEFVWVGEDGIKSQTFGSQVWDASLFLQALLASNLSDEIGPTLMKGHNYLKGSQVRDNPPGDFKKMFRHISKGSWTFSDRDNGWQVSDCTAESLKCCLYFSTMTPEMVGEKMETEQVYDAVNIILYLQSKSGGFSPWEPVRGGFWWEALVLFQNIYPRHREKEIANSIKKATKFIEDAQFPDGSWYGNWGICFFYGTWIALLGLKAAGKNFRNCLAIRKGVDFLLKTQREDGGWGESYLSCPKKVTNI
ncbi:hypothetical protein V6N11_013368 [Hibiscus sabdariffa]|uniref:Terpene cyclase/mutase family member n=1 Tax=Hibiscus sabdariffa TaxID=183260 RepID=A0ABR2NND3_9ROSI